jgi:hypothetical protein
MGEQIGRLVHICLNAITVPDQSRGWRDCVKLGNSDALWVNFTNAGSASEFNTPTSRTWSTLPLCWLRTIFVRGDYRRDVCHRQLVGTLPNFGKVCHCSVTLSRRVGVTDVASAKFSFSFFLVSWFIRWILILWSDWRFYTHHYYWYTHKTVI